MRRCQENAEYPDEYEILAAKSLRSDIFHYMLVTES
jgi:hypothetical protein